MTEVACSNKMASARAASAAPWIGAAMMTPPAVSAADTMRLARYAPAGWGLVAGLRSGRPARVWSAYSAQWQERYAAQNYVFRDPAIAWGLARTGVARWEDGSIPDPWNIIADARDHGMPYGLACSVVANGARTIGGFARSDRPFRRNEARWLLGYVGRMAASRGEGSGILTRQQRAALVRIAAGERIAEAAHEIGISQSAMKARLRGARKTLGARTTAEAVARARWRGELPTMR